MNKNKENFCIGELFKNARIIEGNIDIKTLIDKTYKYDNSFFFEEKERNDRDLEDLYRNYYKYLYEIIKDMNYNGYKKLTYELPTYSTNRYYDKNNCFNYIKREITKNINGIIFFYCSTINKTIIDWSNIKK